MSKLSYGLMALGIIAVIILVIKYRVFIISHLPLSDDTKQKLVQNDPLQHFIDDKDTSQVVYPQDVKQEPLQLQLSYAVQGLIGQTPDSQKSVTDIKREIMEGDWGGITDKQLSDALFGHSTQKTTINENGLVETKEVKEDKLLGATFAQVEKEVSNVIDKVLQPVIRKGDNTIKPDMASQKKVVTIPVINRFTGEIIRSDINNIPSGYAPIG